MININYVIYIGLATSAYFSNELYSHIDKYIDISDYAGKPETSVPMGSRIVRRYNYTAVQPCQCVGILSIGNQD